ncbi:hypothetical protein JGH11_04480 [Dysgonomonas sp. Marseille-P4677]|uniref:hypothetical protein n=1 Tax=Dysgonomonas sp. Marseille-P4677 TaxID=2364790 RepID=UPI001913A5BD|nr:hypothetical protein [Dysgonomonas sp. Marseille-P4677]MBK5720123.1 hypothetical protein [Dysgonomonas sp. Marseille-P4677]
MATGTYVPDPGKPLRANSNHISDGKCKQPATPYTPTSLYHFIFQIHSWKEISV